MSWCCSGTRALVGLTSTAPRGHLGGGAESLARRLRLRRLERGLVQPQTIELAPGRHRALDL
eukprot:8926953-Heterocapsa_arctica.AAC.1